MAIKKTFSKKTGGRPSDGKKPFRRRGPKNKGVRPSDPNAQRLNKILASAGLGSRREVEELIVQGRVEVDREIVTDLSFKVDPRTVTIKVDGSVLKKEQLIYYALNKPPGVLSTNRDPDGRIRVIDLVPDKQRVFSVGRLDRSSEGLILLTNDGELTQRLAHPKFSVQKSYFVVVSGVMTQEELDRLRKGVHLAEGFARIDGATIRRQRKGCTELEIALSEGKNREIRRILARAGHKVVVLRRIAIGPLRLGQLPVGASRILLPAEVRALYAATEHKPARRKHSAPAAGKAPSIKPPIDHEEDNRIQPMLEDEQEYDEEMLSVGIGDEGLDGPGGEFNDDDFVGHFSSSTSGAVLDYDDERASPATPPGRRPAKKSARPQRTPQRTTGGRRTTDAAATGAAKHESNRAAGPGKSSARGGKRASGGKASRPGSEGRGAPAKKRNQAPKSRGSGTKGRSPKGR